MDEFLIHEYEVDRLGHAVVGEQHVWRYGPFESVEEAGKHLHEIGASKVASLGCTEKPNDRPGDWEVDNLWSIGAPDPDNFGELILRRAFWISEVLKPIVLSPDQLKNKKKRFQVTHRVVLTNVSSVLAETEDDATLVAANLFAESIASEGQITLQECERVDVCETE